jgi:UDP-N-acetylmuramoyl-L-alanyl-D-glutamate--2,6-diaminopimelate ligase
MRKFIPRFLLSGYHFLLALIGAIIYGFPSKGLITIGVTGTNGKSTVVHLITEILAPQLRGKIASISSIRFKIGNKEWPNMLKMTMPGRLKLQRFLRQAVKVGCKYAVLEVTSEGIKQYRHKFIDFDGAIFTNLTKEHIEAHKGFQNYKKAKGKLFKTLQKSKKKNKFVVLNADDKHSEYFSKLAGKVKKYYYSLKDLEKINLQISLPGEFNKYNALAAFCTGLALGIEKDKILEVLKNAKGVPGRMELIINKPFKVFVDYAHTPDALEKVYNTLGKGLICVFGSCGGGRDKWKRPEMGKIAGEYCKEVILTNEDPFDEPPQSIIDQIASGISSEKSVYKIIDRREAINKALSLVQKNDIVIITGKGCEQYIRIEKGKAIPWDDRRVVKEEFFKIYGEQRL